MVWQGPCRGKTMVGVHRFELWASWSQTKRSARLSYTPTGLQHTAMRCHGRLLSGRVALAIGAG